MDVLQSTRELAQEATGDIIYACKPLWTSFWPALISSGFGKDKPLLLDVEDREIWLNTLFSLGRFLKIHLVDNWTDVGALRYKVLLHPLAKTVPASVTVSTHALQRIYGGEIILHGPDEKRFSPQLIDESRVSCRKSFGLPPSAPLALFAGTPHPHKGLDTVLRALQREKAENYHLVLAGPPDHPAFQNANRTLGDRCHLLGFVENTDMPRLLHAVDVVPVMQKENAFTEAQMPAKLLEAMAMGKSIVVSPVGDLPQIIGHDTGSSRGWVVEAGNDRQLAYTFRRILDHPDDSQRRRERARNFAQQQTSTAGIARRLRPILKQVTHTDVNSPQ
jgi:glycosyltransferase involved in cell wall biosynthesis